MKLSPEEKQIILKIRQKQENLKPKMTATLIEDLFYLNERIAIDPVFYSKSKKENIIENIQYNFQLACKAGAIFDCYIEEDGRQSWYDRVFGVEAMPEAWAKIHLTNFKPVKSVKRILK